MSSNRVKPGIHIATSCNVYAGQLQPVAVSRRYLTLSDIFQQRSVALQVCRSMYTVAWKLQVQEPIKMCFTFFSSRWGRAGRFVSSLPKVYVLQLQILETELATLRCSQLLCVCRALGHALVRSSLYPWSLTYVRRPWLMEFIKLRYSFNVHAWLPLCVAIWISILKNTDAPSKHCKGRLQLVGSQLYSMRLLTRSHNLINHGLRALVWGLKVWWFGRVN